MNLELISQKEILKCSTGWVLVEFAGRAIHAIDFLDFAPGLKKPRKPSMPAEWASAILRAASGQTFKCPPLSPVGTVFQKAVWEMIQAIPLGKTLSYGEIAAVLGKPRAARAVGAACGANPIPLLIPCHRVLASNGTLGGFSGGLAIKKALLAAENAVWRET